MAKDIRATVEFPRTACPISARPGDTPATVDGASTGPHPEGSGPVVEFSVDAEDGHHADIEAMYSDGPVDRQRLAGGDSADCPCARLGALGCPIRRYTARNETLTLEFEASDYEHLRRALGALRAAFPDANVRRLRRASTPG